ncbi:hypothetical protein [Streptomyces sp. H62]
MTLLTSSGAVIDSELLPRVRSTAPWYAPKGNIRLSMNGTVYWVRLQPEQVDDAMEAAATAWRRRP